MPNKGLRRIQLILLLLVGILVIWRMTASPAGKGFVTLADMDTRELLTRHFEVLTPTTIVVDGEVSFEDDRAGSDLAVLAWILDRSSGDLVWRTTVDNVTREGVRAAVHDSLQLDAGNYTVHYSTYGPDNASYRGGSAFGLKPHWTNYESYWHLDLSAPDGTVDLDNRFVTASASGASLFRVALDDRRSEQSAMFFAEGQSSVHIHGGITRCAARCDEIFIKSIPSGVVQWTADEVDVTPAGGSRINQWIDTEVSLPEGAYEIDFEPGSHPGRWSENPPWRPESFVFTLEPGAQGTVRPLDPWALSEPLVDQSGLGDDELVETRLVLQDSLDVILFAMGEMNSSSQRYDWGWIERESDGERIWQMEYDQTTPAGGGSKNRQTRAILTLAPGSYLVAFETDGSHSVDGFNSSRPNHPERWGLAIFPLNPGDVDESRIQVEELERARPMPEPETPSGSALSGIAAERFLVRMTSIGNSADRADTFQLSDSTDVVVMALGELTESSRYDWGWIESEDGGEIIWEMNWNNTTWAGGDESYRSARVELTLPPGRYRARFQTDGSVAYGGFGSDYPDNPEDWGIAIFRAD